MPTESELQDDLFGLSTEGFIALVVVAGFLALIAVGICLVQLYRWQTKAPRKKRAKRKHERAIQYTSFVTHDDDVEFNPSRGNANSKQASLEPIEEEELQRLSFTRLELSARYYTHRDKLQIAVKEAQLGNVEDSLLNNGFLYVALKLIPDTKNAFETALVPVASHVDIDELCEFDIVRPDVIGRSLLATVCICDRYSKHRTLAEITYSLQRDEDEDDVVKGEMSLEKLRCMEVSRVETTEGMAVELDDVLVGELLFSLCYMPTAGRLTVVVMKGRSLPLNDELNKGIIIKASVIIGSKLLRTVQTSPVSKARCPVYNEAFVFNVPFSKANDTNIVVSVMHEKTNRMIGRIVVGPDSDTMTGKSHWRSAMASPRRPIAQWHCLVQYL